MAAIADSAATLEVRPRRLLVHVNLTLGVGLAIVLAVLAIALLIPLVSPYTDVQITAADSLTPPSIRHWLGADDLGRDVLVRVAVGYRISLSVAIGSVLLALIGGVPLGLLAGYAGGTVENMIMRPLDVFMAFPPILLAITVIAIAGTGIPILILALAIVYVPIIARVTRAATLVVRGELFVRAARVRGASHFRIVLRHVLPNSMGPVIVQASILMGWAILLEAALSFIGLGVRPPTPALGSMLAAERDYMGQAPWVVIGPGLAIMMLVLGFNLIGDGLSDWLDPRGRARIR